MKTISRFGVTLAALALVVSAATVALADPPSRVARLQYITGAVSVQPGGVKDWVEGAVNRPLTTADRVWADKDSRAEMHLGGALMRINSETSLTLTNVGDEAVQVELDQGTLNLRIRHLYDGEIFEVDTPNLAFTVTKSGEYRFDVDPNGDTTLVTVRHGEGEATGEGRAVKIHKNEQARFSGGTSLNHEIDEAPSRDGFEDWCHVRDEREDHSVSARYVSPDVIGAEDLDAYGTWRTVPAYGAVWVPAVAPGWAPYHYGHWVWVEPWGWTWVDDAPWGFAPCHYGRWVYYGGAWGWVPGPVAVRPVYAPALVAWVGGNHWGVGLSFGAGGGVGWFPLGYGEPYVPAYHVSRNYFQNVNVSNTHITNITNVTNNYYTTTNVTNNTTNVTKIVYKNQSVPGATTAVSKTVLTNGQPVGRAAVKVTPTEVRTASIAAAPEVAPSKASVLGVHGESRAVPPAQSAQQRQVVSKLAPPERPVPFSAKQEALATNPGRPLDASAEAQIRARVGTQTPSPRAENPQSERTVTPKPATPANAGPRITPSDSPKQADGQKVANTPAPATPNPGTPSPAASTASTPAVRPNTGRFVPRPGAPAASGQTSLTAAPAENPQQGRSVPRPPTAGRDASATGPGAPATPAAVPSAPASPVRNVPAPPAVSRPATPAATPTPAVSPNSRIESPRPVSRPVPRPSSTETPRVQSNSGDFSSSPRRSQPDTASQPRAVQSPQVVTQPREQQRSVERPQPTPAVAPRQTPPAPRPAAQESSRPVERPSGGQRQAPAPKQDQNKKENKSDEHNHNR